MTSGETGTGMRVFNSDNVTVVNSGLIHTTNNVSPGIGVIGASDNTHVINSGTIISDMHHAVRFGNSTNPILTL